MGRPSERERAASDSKVLEAAYDFLGAGTDKSVAPVNSMTEAERPRFITVRVTEPEAQPARTITVVELPSTPFLRARVPCVKLPIAPFIPGFAVDPVGSGKIKDQSGVVPICAEDGSQVNNGRAAEIFARYGTMMTPANAAILPGMCQAYT